MNTQLFSGSLRAIPEIVRVTLRQLMGRRRTLLLLILSAVPILLAVLLRAAGTGTANDFTGAVLDAIGVTILLPIVAILFGTAAFGAEIEDGTVVYLMAKPISRWAVVLAKLIGAAGVTILLTVGSTIIAGAIYLLPLGQTGVDATVGFAAAMFTGSVCYVALFVTVSLFTRRALVIGIGYMLIWEGALASLLPGIANLSIRQYSLGLARAFYPIAADEARLAAGTALTLASILVVVAVVLATRRLMRFELPGSTD